MVSEFDLLELFGTSLFTVESSEEEDLVSAETVSDVPAQSAEVDDAAQATDHVVEVAPDDDEVATDAQHADEPAVLASDEVMEQLVSEACDDVVADEMEAEETDAASEVAARVDPQGAPDVHAYDAIDQEAELLQAEVELEDPPYVRSVPEAQVAQVAEECLEGSEIAASAEMTDVLEEAPVAQDVDAQVDDDETVLPQVEGELAVVIADEVTVEQLPGDEVPSLAVEETAFIDDEQVEAMAAEQEAIVLDSAQAEERSTEAVEHVVELPSSTDVVEEHLTTEPSASAQETEDVVEELPPEQERGVLVSDTAPAMQDALDTTRTTDPPSQQDDIPTRVYDAVVDEDDAASEPEDTAMLDTQEQRYDLEDPDAILPDPELDASADDDEYFETFFSGVFPLGLDDDSASDEVLPEVEVDDSGRELTGLYTVPMVEAPSTGSSSEVVPAQAVDFEANITTPTRLVAQPLQDDLRAISALGNTSAAALAEDLRSSFTREEPGTSVGFHVLDAQSRQLKDHPADFEDLITSELEALGIGAILDDEETQDADCDDDDDIDPDGVGDERGSVHDDPLKTQPRLMAVMVDEEPEQQEVATVPTAHQPPPQYTRRVSKPDLDELGNDRLVVHVAQELERLSKQDLPAVPAPIDRTELVKTVSVHTRQVADAMSAREAIAEVTATAITPSPSVEMSGDMPAHEDPSTQAICLPLAEVVADATAVVTESAPARPTRKVQPRGPSTFVPYVAPPTVVNQRPITRWDMFIAWFVAFLSFSHKKNSTAEVTETNTEGDSAQQGHLNPREVDTAVIPVTEQDLAADRSVHPDITPMPPPMRTVHIGSQAYMVGTEAHERVVISGGGPDTDLDPTGETQEISPAQAAVIREQVARVRSGQHVAEDWFAGGGFSSEDQAPKEEVYFTRLGKVSELEGLSFTADGRISGGDDPTALAALLMQGPTVIAGETPATTRREASPGHAISGTASVRDRGGNEFYERRLAHASLPAVKKIVVPEPPEHKTPRTPLLVRTEAFALDMRYAWQGSVEQVMAFPRYLAFHTGRTPEVIMRDLFVVFVLYMLVIVYGIHVF